METQEMLFQPDFYIWDFNGTILDDVEVGIRSVNHLLRERGLRTIESREAYRQIFGFPVEEYYRKLGFDFEKEPYEVIAPLWVEQYLKNVKDAPLFDDVKKTWRFSEIRGSDRWYCPPRKRKCSCLS